MQRRMPRLELIEAFIHAAQGPNFRTAAEKCALSPAAFSRRIQAFTAYVGHEVFERRPEGMRLTSEGQRCLALLEPLYRDMREATLGLGRRGPGGKVTLSLSHSLAVGWLIPRLDRFRELHPQLDVVIRTQRTAEHIRSGEADLGVCATDVDLSRLRNAHFLEMMITPVASPEVAGKFNASACPLTGHRLLGMRQHPDLWAWWAKEAAVGGAGLKATATFDVQHAMYEAASAGLGIALGSNATFGPHLQSGRLVSLGLPSVTFPVTYRLAATVNRLRSPTVRKLWAWLLDEARLHTIGWRLGSDTVAARSIETAAA